MFVWTDREPWQVLKRWWLLSGNSKSISFGDWILHHIRRDTIMAFKCAECGKEYMHEGWLKGHLDKTGHKSPTSQSSQGTVPKPAHENPFSMVGMKLTVLGKDLSFEEFMQLYDEMTKTRNMLKEVNAS
jgi:hypothetical protein